MLATEQLELLLAEVSLPAGARLLELGCGSGRLAEYLAEHTGAQVTGLDLSAAGIALAQDRAAALPGRLAFVCADMAAWDYPPAAFDLVLAVDALAFVPAIPPLLLRLRSSLRPGGRLAIFHSAWAAPDQPDAGLLPAGTRVGVALASPAAGGWRYRVWDLRRQETAHWQRKLANLS
jgi:cyclopropane fatty-acyl-phospholipid synthase-like methyltransferase